MPNIVDISKHKRKHTSRNNVGGRKTQLEKILDAGSAVYFDAKPASEDMLFLSRLMVQAFLPHSDPKDIAWQRKNGNFTLTVKSGIGFENGKSKTYGLPYGSIPRLLFAWLNTEAVRNAKDPNNDNPRRIYMGNSLSEFLDKIGVDKSGGKKGGITRFKKQAERLFRSEISIQVTGKNFVEERDMKITDGRFIFWDTSSPDQMSFFESYIEISEPLFKIFVNNPFPLDWRILGSLKQSPMALDLYYWLSHRVCYIKQPVEIKWETLQQQFGSDVSDIRKFRQTVRKHLKKIKAIWRMLKIDDSRSDCLIIYPSPPLIPPSKMDSYTLV